jgi:hypothetical protein
VGVEAAGESETLLFTANIFTIDILDGGRGEKVG